ncbi:hypothetical protein APY03_1908 [Variovorax sp. WDL1]|nr:hypothetical protein APY03_1908 [Variovorax sp. WDL1]
MRHLRRAEPLRRSSGAIQKRAIGPVTALSSPFFAAVRQ